jgi:gliding motility-associated-like protein
MRKILLASILFISGISYALHVEGVGNRTFIDNDGDALYIFESNPEFQSNIGTIDWYRLPDTIAPFSSGTDYLYPEHGQGYAVKVGGQWQHFWVFEYDSLRPQVNGVEAVLSCTSTSLLLDGVVPTIQYMDLQSKLQTLPRLCRVSYMDAMWGENDWVDSLAVVEKEYTTSIVLDASPVMTNYVITDLLALELNLNDSIVTDTYQPMAIKTHPQAIVTVRGAEGERSNEVERPIDADNLIRRSAPLEVEFLANALNADYYHWNLYKGTELILQRSEAQHRYTFTEPGNYRLMLGASNMHDCAIDSVQFDISVSESMLTVPNTFTPNGDGTNDEFRVVYRSIKEFHIWVYNRWGKLVYKSSDPAKGWDGTINGRPATSGAYYYVIRALGTDAEADYMSKPSYSKKLKKQELPIGVYQLSGDINLLR